MNAVIYEMELRAAPRRTQCGSAVHLPVRSLVRSINFFSTVLGYEVVRDGRREACPYVVMTARGSSPLVLHLRSEPARLQNAAAGAALTVADLERARARAWDAGALIARGSSPPARIVEREGRRFLYVRDPDGHELELAATD